MSEVIRGPFDLVALAVVLSGGLKLARTPAALAALLKQLRVRNPVGSARAIGVVECSVGSAALIATTQLTVSGVVVLYVAFAAIIAYILLVKLPVESCGCFGLRPLPPSWLHVGANLFAASIAGVALLAGPPSGASILRPRPEAVSFILGVCTATYLCFQLVALLPAITVSYRVRRKEVIP